MEGKSKAGLMFAVGCCSWLHFKPLKRIALTNAMLNE